MSSQAYHLFPSLTTLLITKQKQSSIDLCSSATGIMSSSRQVSFNLGSIDDERGHVTEEQMEWKVIFMSQVWQLAIVPSLRYCAARS